MDVARLYYPSELNPVRITGISRLKPYHSTYLLTARTSTVLPSDSSKLATAITFPRENVSYSHSPVSTPDTNRILWILGEKGWVYEVENDRMVEVENWGGGEESPPATKWSIGVAVDAFTFFLAGGHLISNPSVLSDQIWRGSLTPPSTLTGKYFIRWNLVGSGLVNPPTYSTGIVHFRMVEVVNAAADIVIITQTAKIYFGRPGVSEWNFCEVDWDLNDGYVVTAKNIDMPETGITEHQSVRWAALDNRTFLGIPVVRGSATVQKVQQHTYLLQINFGSWQLQFQNLGRLEHAPPLGNGALMGVSVGVAETVVTVTGGSRVWTGAGMDTMIPDSHNVSAVGKWKDGKWKWMPYVVQEFWTTQLERRGATHSEVALMAVPFQRVQTTNPVLNSVGMGHKFIFWGDKPRSVEWVSDDSANEKGGRWWEFWLADFYETATRVDSRKFWTQISGRSTFVESLGRGS